MKPDDILGSLPLVAILRGVKPDEAAAVGNALYSSGFRCIEVPLNSPDPLASIETLVETLPADSLIGAGTVLSELQVDAVRDAGGRLIVSPDTNPAVISRAAATGMLVMPGIATATEAFVALRSGAENFKLFPASTYGAGHAKALCAVLPASCRLFAVGGVGPAVLGEWLAAGIFGFGAGSELYRAGDSAAAVSGRALDFVRQYRQAVNGITRRFQERQTL